MSKKFYLTAGALLLLLSVNAQELLTPLTFMGPAVDGRARHAAPVAVLDTIALPSNGFRDNFMYDSNRPDTVLWDLGLQPGVYVNRGWATAPINIGVCTFDGLNWNGLPYDQLASVNSSMVCDVLTSKHFDLTDYDPSDSLMLSFWWEAQGRGYAPNQADSLQLQVNIPAWNTAGEVWKTVWFKEGYNPQGADSSFHVAMFKLDSASYFADGFRFRFRNYGAGCGSNDHWHIDEVLFKPFRTAADTFINNVYFVYNMPSLLRDYTQVPGDHYVSSLMASTIPQYIRNNDTIQRQVSYSYRVFAQGNPTPLYTYGPAPDGNLLPFSQSHAYSAVAAVANSPVTYQYTPFTVPDTGYYRVEHELLKTTGDTDYVDYYQRMYNQYAYDDGTAEVGYGIFGPGALLAYRFDMPVGVLDTLTAVQMYFLPVLDIDNLVLREFRLTVWNHNTSTNGPGTIIYQQRHENPKYAPDCPNRFSTYTIDSGIVVLSGTFYVGWVQEASDRLYLGMDFENNQQDKIYYNTTGIWYTSVYEGALMMRPVFGDSYFLTDVNETQGASAISVFPNPATDQVFVAGLTEMKQYDATLVDLSGRTVINQAVTSSSNMLDVSALAPGVYVLSVTDEYGIRSGTQKIVVE